MIRAKSLKKCRLAFAIAACVATALSGGVLFGIPALGQILNDEETFSGACDGSASSRVLCLGDAKTVALITTLGAVTSQLAPGAAQLLLVKWALSGRVVYALSALLFSIGCVIYCVFSTIDIAVIVAFALIVFTGNLCASTLRQSATTRTLRHSSQLGEVSVISAQVFGAGVVAFMAFLHEVFILSSVVLIGGLAVGTTLFVTLTVIFWPRGPSVPDLPTIQVHTTTGDEEETTASEDDPLHAHHPHHGPFSQARTSLDHIVSRFSPSYGSVSEDMNSLWRPTNRDRMPLYGDRSFWRKMATPEAIIFMIYYSFITSWIFFYLGSAHYRLKEAGEIAHDNEYIQLLTWLLAASSVLVPVCKLMADRLGLVGSTFLLHVSFSLWSLCLVLRESQLVLLSFILLGATRGILEGVSLVFWRRLFGSESGAKMAALASFTSAALSVVIFPVMVVSIDIFHEGKARGFFLPTIVQDASAVALLCLPILLWFRNVDAAESD